MTWDNDIDLNLTSDDNDIEIILEDDTELILDLEEQTTETYEGSWQILVVDDDSEIHAMTKVALRGFVFENKPLTLISAYSATEAKNILATKADIAMVLLDVVMEEKDSGLQVVKYIREDLNNQLLRIILRTGQPGEAPEEATIVNYNINDYKTKTELTQRKLFTAIISTLRSYRHVMTIETNRRAIETQAQALKEEITKRKAIETALRDSLERIRLITNALPALISYIDADHQYPFANTHYQAWFGISPPEIERSYYHEAINKIANENIQKLIEQASQGKEVSLVPLQPFAKDKTRFVRITYTPHFNEEGEILGFFSLTQNLTDLESGTTEPQPEQVPPQAITPNFLLFNKSSQPNLGLVYRSHPAGTIRRNFHTYRAFGENKGYRLTIAMGHISDKDINAALLLSVSVALLEAAMFKSSTPEHAIDYLEQNITPYLKATSQTCTLAYAEITSSGWENEACTLQMVNAGGIPIIIRHVDGSLEAISTSCNALGVLSSEKQGYNQITLTIKKGDLIILASDGIIKIKNSNQEIFGFDRLQEVIKQSATTSGEALLIELWSYLETFAGETKPDDDMSIIIVEI